MIQKKRHVDRSLNDCSSLLKILRQAQDDNELSEQPHSGSILPKLSTCHE